jgi:flagellar protein FliS
MYQNGFQSYRKTNVVTADPGKLVIMCYEGAIDNLIIAKQKYAEKKYEAKCKHMNKAKDIIDELLCSLNFEKGGAIAGNLESLYNYMTRKIILADINKDMEGMDEVVGLLRELLSAWKAVCAKPDRAMQPEAVSLGENKRPQASGYAGM